MITIKLSKNITFFISGILVSALILIPSLLIIGPKYTKSEELRKVGDHNYDVGIYKQAVSNYQDSLKEGPLKKFDSKFTKRLEDTQIKAESMSDFILFLKNEVDEGSIQNFIKALESTQGIEKVKYISSEDALKIYQEKNKDDPALLELVTANILPASIEVYVINSTEAQKISTQFKTHPLVEDIITLDF